MKRRFPGRNDSFTSSVPHSINANERQLVSPKRSAAVPGLSYSSLGVIEFIIGTAAGQHNIAAGIGYYGAAISIYERWIKPGREVTFARDTRLVLQTRASPPDAP